MSNIPRDQLKNGLEAATKKEERMAKKRFYTFLKTVYNVANLAGLHIEGRIKVKDIKTGKVWE